MMSKVIRRGHALEKQKAPYEYGAFERRHTGLQSPLYGGHLSGLDARCFRSAGTLKPYAIIGNLSMSSDRGRGACIVEF